MNDVLGLLNCHNSPELGELTSVRPLASTPFLGRYAFCDFALSNFCNSGIPQVGIMVKNHQRSILKHLGSMNSWVVNTKLGKFSILYNEKGQLNQLYNTDLRNIEENDYVLYDSKASMTVFQSAHIVANIDLRPIIEEHKARREVITVLYKKIDDADKEFIGENLLDIDENGYIVDFHMNKGKDKKGNASMEVWIINRSALLEMVEKHPQVDMSWGLKEMLLFLFRKLGYKIHTHEYKGYARCFNSMENYVNYSFEVLDGNISKQIFLPERPIYTQTHNTPPALYGSQSKVSNSFVSNGCEIHGTVKDSILSRNVKVGPGAKLERCIVLTNGIIGRNSVLQNVILDKFAKVSPKHIVSGDDDHFIYLEQGAEI